MDKTNEKYLRQALEKSKVLSELMSSKIKKEIVDKIVKSNTKILTESPLTPAQFIFKHNRSYFKKFIEFIKEKKPIYVDRTAEEGKSIIVDIDDPEMKKLLSSLEQILYKVTDDKEAIIKLNNIFKKSYTQYLPVIKATDGTMYTLANLSKSTFTSKSSPSGERIPGEASYYEMAIVVAYNQSKGMSEQEAMRIGNVDPKKFESHGKFLRKVGKLIVKSLHNVSVDHMEYTGASKAPSISTKWMSFGAKDTTPKTDMFGDQNNKFSLKKTGGSQLMSGGAGESAATFYAALEYLEKYNENNVKKLVEEIVSDIKKDFVSFASKSSVTDLKETLLELYIAFRLPVNNRNKSLEKQAEMELNLMMGSIVPKSFKFEPGFGDRVGEQIFKPAGKIITMKELESSFRSTLKDKKIFSSELPGLQKEMSNIFEGSIDTRKIKAKTENLLQNDEYKKWIVFEAATGNFKFTGEAKKSTNSKYTANQIFVFGTDGFVDIQKITEDWCISHAPSVKVDVGWKSSGGGISNVTRLALKESNFKKSFGEIISEEISILDKVLLEEGFTDDMRSLGSKAKEFGSDLLSKIKDSIKNFYENVIKKTFNILLEYADRGLKILLEFLGFEIYGSAFADVKF